MTISHVFSRNPATAAVGACLLAMALLGVPSPACAAENLSEKEAMSIGTDAYIFGYPLVTMEMTRRVMTNVEQAGDKHAPMGQFAKMRQYPDASFKEITAPNADTLYEVAWLDLAREPYVLSIPEAKDRYYMVPMLDGWTTVFEDPGTRTMGTKAQAYAIVGPNWKGTLPKGVKEYKSPTNMVWLLGRIYCTGTSEDYRAVHAMQDHTTLVPLSVYGKPYEPPKGKVDPNIDMKTPVRDQVNQMDAAGYFKLLAGLMKDNPPAAADAAMVASMAKIGLVPGQDFDMSKLDPAVAKAIDAAPKAALEKIMAHEKSAGKVVNGWLVTMKTGVYGDDYLQRALITMIGLGANRAADAVYPMAKVDVDGKTLSGANRYVMHFDKGMTPPVNGFWSLTMYNTEYFFVNNPLNKYTVSPRNDLTYNSDGSLDVYVQKESPGKDKEANWLPAPAGSFVLCLRMYWPKETTPSILNGTWQPPPVKQAAEMTAGK